MTKVEIRGLSMEAEVHKLLTSAAASVLSKSDSSLPSTSNDFYLVCDLHYQYEDYKYAI